MFKEWQEKNQIITLKLNEDSMTRSMYAAQTHQQINQAQPSQIQPTTQNHASSPTEILVKFDKDSVKQSMDQSSTSSVQQQQHLMQSSSTNVSIINMDSMEIKMSDLNALNENLNDVILA